MKISGNKNQKGFTLMELIVAVAIFLVVMTISLGSVLTIIDAGRKARNLKAVMTNLNFAVETMSREIKFGSDYHCGIAEGVGVSEITAPSFVRSGGSTGTYLNFDIGSPNSNRLVVVIVGDESENINLSGVTVDGASCNLIVRANNTVGVGNHQEMFYCDEDNLGSSSGTVPISVSGGDAGWATHALLYTGVSQNGPRDYGIDQTSNAVNTITVNGIDVSEKGLVVAGWGEGTGNLSINSQTSPLSTKRNGPDPSSADLFSSSGTETSVQTGKTYSVTLSAEHLRATGIVASWDPSPVEVEGPPPESCTGEGSDPGNSITFLNSDDETIIYRLYNNQIQKSTDGGSTYFGVTSPDIHVEDLDYYVFGALPGDTIQPRVLMLIKGYAGEKQNSQSRFIIQTTVSQRALDS